MEILKIRLRIRNQHKKTHRKHIRFQYIGLGKAKILTAYNTWSQGDHNQSAKEW